MSPHDPEPTSPIGGDRLARARAGEPEALAELLDTHYERVLAIVRRRLGQNLRRHHESGDVVQEAMLQVVQGIGRFDADNEDAFVGWMAGIVENRIRDLAKYHGAQKRDHARERRAGSIEVRDESDPLERVGSAGDRPSPLTEIANDEQSRRLDAAIEQLESKRRDVIRLRQAELPWADVATRLGLASDGAARMLHSRALVELARTVERMGTDSPDGG